RRRATEPVEDFFPQEVAEDAAELRELLEAWAERAVDRMAATRPARIDGLRDRTNEVWRPLLAIGELAGENWSARAPRARLRPAGGARARAGADADDEASLGVPLLGDIQPVSEGGKLEGIATTGLVGALARFEESPGGEWWFEKDNEPQRNAPRRLAQLLRPF